MSARVHELDHMADHAAIASLEAEFPGWMVWRDPYSGLCRARWHEHPDVAVHDANWADLRDGIIGAIWRLV